MKNSEGQTILSASDLVNFAGCRHRTGLDIEEAAGRRRVPPRHSPVLEALALKGAEHEQAFVEELRRSGLSVVEVPEGEPEMAARAMTLDAMAAGADAVVQAHLAAGRWQGRVDVLQKVNVPVGERAWSYEPIDAKLGRETRAGAILQLCVYADLLQAIDGSLPQHIHVARPGDDGTVVETYRTADFAAYFRMMRLKAERFIEGAGEDPSTAVDPEPVEACETCRWSPQCEKRWRAEDHLSFVAGISRLQRDECRARGVHTLSELARLPLPLDPKPERGSVEAWARVIQQAAIQMRSRESGRIQHEFLPVEDGRGFCRLPEPSSTDLFLDLERARWAVDEGLEYLWGVCDAEGAYTPTWALNHPGERQAFESFVDEVMRRRKADPAFHVYHFGHYEVDAIKRLMGKYATREDEVDAILRASVFIDLHRVFREGVRAGVESYSLKALEGLAGYKREVGLGAASDSMVAVEVALSEKGGEPDDAVKSVVEGYNRDDCRATRALREWLEAARAQAIETGAAIPRPSSPEGEAPEGVAAARAEVAAVMAPLLDGVPDRAEDRDPAQQARWLLAHLLEYYRREDKSTWWEHFRLRDLPPEELLEEKAAVGGLKRLRTTVDAKGRAIEIYEFAPQDTDISLDDTVYAAGKGASREKPASFGVVVPLDLIKGEIGIRRGKNAAAGDPESVFAWSLVQKEVLAASLLSLARSVVEEGIDGPGRFRAARDLLLRIAPRVNGERPAEGRDPHDRALAYVPALASGVLPIQGPPGSGKTYTGARMICEAVRNGLRVGVTALSHKVIRNLLDEVARAAAEEKIAVRMLQKDDSAESTPEITVVKKYPPILKALADGSADIVAGSAWLWARDDFAESVDILFVDEAGQMALPDVLACARAARSLVLLGDPQQLERPQQGTHPEGTSVSALEHILSGEKTIRDDQGIFLSDTRRLHPEICAFTSEVFYEGRLQPHAGLARQELLGCGSLSGAGLRFIEVVHEGNQSSSSEEVAVVEGLVATLTASGSKWRDRYGAIHDMTLNDVLVVAPYNAQVQALSRCLPQGARVGTVDKFQGQEAPVVIYSMTTSSPEDAPRGMGFLYSLNRFNVATSRARCVTIVVASPRLLEPQCRTPTQIRLVNALCRFLEIADSKVSSVLSAASG